jgi:hypothetical protein
MLCECNYNSPANRLCREVSFQINDREMLKVNARMLTQPKIQTGPNSKATGQIGRIRLDGHLFTPKPISALAITYFGAYAEQEADIMDRFCTTLLNVSLLNTE